MDKLDVGTVLRKVIAMLKVDLYDIERGKKSRWYSNPEKKLAVALGMKQEQLMHMLAADNITVKAVVSEIHAECVAKKAVARSNGKVTRMGKCKVRGDDRDRLRQIAQRAIDRDGRITVRALSLLASKEGIIISKTTASRELQRMGFYGKKSDSIKGAKKDKSTKENPVPSSAAVSEGNDEMEDEEEEEDDELNVCDDDEEEEEEEEDMSSDEDEHEDDDDDLCVACGIRFRISPNADPKPQVNCDVCGLSYHINCAASQRPHYSCTSEMRNEKFVCPGNCELKYISRFANSKKQKK